jgi:hypothetical protein
LAKKNGKRRSRGKGFTIPIAVVAGLAAPAIKIWEHRTDGASGMAREAGRILTGVDFWNGVFEPGNMRFGLLPVVGGMMVHWLVGGKLGVNRMIARTGLPFIRL